MSVRPFGTWPSPLSASVVSRGAGRVFGGVWLNRRGVRWLEYRADEGGRGVVVSSGFGNGDVSPADITPAGYNVRSRVQELGGGACWFHRERVFFSHFDDSRLYCQDGAGAEPRALTPQPAEPNSLRYADGTVTADGANIVCVRERHARDGVHNELVALPSDGSAEPHAIVSGRDFVAGPRFDAVGRRLAWLSWDHPRMPWDGTELWVGELGSDGILVNARLVAGGAEESIFQPEWSPDGVLHFCSDRTGWWNLQRLGHDGVIEQLTRLDDGEIGWPAWELAMRRYAFLGDGRIACVVTRAATDSLALLDPGSGALQPLELEWTEYDASALDASGDQLAFAAVSPGSPSTVVVADLPSGGEHRVRRSLDLELEQASISHPRAIEFSTADGAVAHAFYYPPASPAVTGPPGERPPLRVFCHGGPTAHRGPQLDLRFQYFAQRGIGVVDVNYRGSSGFGREYRRLLYGRWGEIDWRDCVDAARHLAQCGDADPDRTWVQGASAGGYVVMCSLAFDPTAFAAGVSVCGVANAETLALDTHKFESRYLDTLIGPYPERADLYRERSPINFVDRLQRPLLLLQGLDDEIVPPSQAEAMVDALERKGIPHAYIAFEGEGHGFRRAENIRRALEAELYFIGRVFGFEPADELEPLPIAHLDN